MEGGCLRRKLYLLTATRAALADPKAFTLPHELTR